MQGCGNPDVAGPETGTVPAEPSRSAVDSSMFFIAMLRGFRGVCPQCGEGKLLQGYLKPNERCSHCGVDTGKIYTADIAPYFTIMIVGHIIVPGLLLSERVMHPNLWLQAGFWLTLALVMTLWFLPRVKGCIMGLMWALGMRGHESQ